MDTLITHYCKYCGYFVDILFVFPQNTHFIIVQENHVFIALGILSDKEELFGVNIITKSTNDIFKKRKCNRFSGIRKSVHAFKNDKKYSYFCNYKILDKIVFYLDIRELVFVKNIDKVILLVYEK